MKEINRDQAYKIKSYFQALLIGLVFGLIMGVLAAGAM